MGPPKVTEGQFLSESIDMRIHRGGRELTQDIYAWSCDVEEFIEYTKDFYFQKNWQIFDDEIIDLQYQYVVYKDNLAELKEAVDAAAVESEAVDAEAVWL